MPNVANPGFNFRQGKARLIRAAERAIAEPGESREQAARLLVGVLRAEVDADIFLTFLPTAHLDGRHTAFGRVVEGMEVLARLQRRDPDAADPPEPDRIVEAEVLRKRDHEYAPTKVR